MYTYRFIFLINAQNIIVEYYKLCYIYINFLNKTTSKCPLLLFRPFFQVFFFINISMSLDQFLSY